ncbi:hypothetical protein CEXT_433811 [Caerostris extrusa]|uniref:Uncharacterized protein n=1 Tax=Caerostris extrusa TaxID=172846 RepID=A0AAV4TP48_CAEEX|nr:hypothetical protein CEXT_433811 [Caerostris extrusa]
MVKESLQVCVEDDDAMDLLDKLLVLDPKSRIDARHSGTSDWLPKSPTLPVSPSLPQIQAVNSLVAYIPAGLHLL